MTVFSYKTEFESDKIEIDIPQKNGKIYKSQLHYDDGSDFIIQTPKVTKDGSTLKFQNDTFLKTIESIENSIVNSIYKRSKEFFGGKSFSLDKIKNSLQRSWDINEQGQVLLNCITSPDVEFSDIFNQKLTIDELSGKVTVILQVSSVTFTKSLFQINYTILRVKSTKIQSETIDFLQETAAESVESTALVTTTEPEVDDTLDFFD